MNYKKSLFIITLVMIFAFFSFSTVLAFPEDVPTQDVTDSSDHSLISRFPGSIIRFYETKDYDEFTLPLNELNDAEFKDEYKEFTEKELRLEGKMTQHFYVVPENHSSLEIFRNYEQALKENDFEIIVQKNGSVDEGFRCQLYEGIDFKDAS